MSPETGKELKKDRKRAEAAVKSLRKQARKEDRAYLSRQDALKQDRHAALPEKALAGQAFSGRGNLRTEENVRRKACDVTEELQNYLQPEKRTGADLKTIRRKLSDLDKTLNELSGGPGGLSPELRLLQKDIRQKLSLLDRLTAKNVPVNPEAFRSFEEVGAGIAADDAAGLLVSDILRTFSDFLAGKHLSGEQKSTEDSGHVLNEIDAMQSRHRYTKEQQALDLMEQESLGSIITRPNRVLQEAAETDHKSQVRRETGAHEESAELFENRKGQEERDALGKKHEILKDITRANRNNLRQKQAKDGLEAVRGMMHNGERGMGFAPLAAMGLGGNLYKGFTGMNFMVSMTSAALNKKQNRAELQGITERYLGLDQLYRNFMTKNSDLRNRTAFLKRYGMEGNVRVMIRKEQDKALGIGTENRMNSFLTRKYAQELWKGAFLKEDGSVITEQERQREAPAQRQRRKLFADMLRAMGFHVRYPTTEGELPGTSASEIFLRMAK